MTIYEKYQMLFRHEDENNQLRFDLLCKFLDHICKYRDDNDLANDIDRIIIHMSALDDESKVYITTMIHELKDIAEDLEEYEICGKHKKIIEAIKNVFGIVVKSEEIT